MLAALCLLHMGPQLSKSELKLLQQEQERKPKLFHGMADSLHNVSSALLCGLEQAVKSAQLPAQRDSTSCGGQLQKMATLSSLYFKLECVYMDASAGNRTP